MPYTPVELRHVKLGRALLGFKRDETERVLGDVADSFEEVWRERGELGDRVEDLERRLDELKQREALLASTLVSAEKAASDAKEAAKREAELIVAEAHGEARSIVRAAQSERERLFAEARRVEALLRSALGMVAEVRASDAPPTATPPAPEAAPAPAPPAAPFSVAPVEAPPATEPAAERPPVPTLPPAPEHWPNRTDTREFQVVRIDDPEAEAESESGPPAPEALFEQPHLPDVHELHGEEPREFAWGD
jgi:cell division initiation protein